KGAGRDRDDNGGGIGALLLAMLAPLIAMLMQYAISRQREFAADRVGAEIAGAAKPLAQALTRIEAMARQIPLPVQQQFAALAIQNPLAGMRGGLSRLMSSHPPTEERVKALLALDAGR
ncbi:MAG TPA: M48 family metalloprotease, partial [Gemmatimonadales bacterium]|nr:M48 family metalloprotease [Gemmatimonadales bacterium]